MGCLGRPTCTAPLISAQTSQEGFKCTKDKEYLGSYCLNIYCDRKKETVIGEAQRKCETMHNSFVFCLVNFFFSFFHVLPCHVCMFLLFFFFCTTFLSKQEIKGVNMQDRRKKSFQNCHDWKTVASLCQMG